jgi:Zn-dependent alcohol dehydrogenase
MKTKAAILVAQNAPLEVDDVEVPRPSVGQVLVKIGHSGICGKQVDEILGKRPDPFIPHLLGHEAAGIVEDVGPGVRKVRPGDSVVLHWLKGSGIDSDTPKFKRRGAAINAGWITTFSERTVVSENRVTRVDPAVPSDVAALLGCAVTTGLGIVINNAQLKPGDSIAVFGAGGVGINVIQAAALVNAHPIIAVDVNDGKLAWAKAFGATHVVNSSREDPVLAVKAIAGSDGVHASVDTVGHPTVRTAAYDATGKAGVTVFAGVPRAEDRLSFDSFPLQGGRRVVGSHGGEARPDVDIPRCVRLFQLGKFKLKEQITHRFPLERVNEAIEIVRSGEAGRCLLAMN